MTELSDKEIVAACARAMGYTLQEYLPMGLVVQHLRSMGPRPSYSEFLYNPLTDRAQAMELQWWMISQGWCVSAEFDDRLEVYKTQRSVFSANRVDSEQAFRRAICLCAARVQIEKEKNADD